MTYEDQVRTAVTTELHRLADDLDSMVTDRGPGNTSTGYGQAGRDIIGLIRARARESTLGCDIHLNCSVGTDTEGSISVLTHLDSCLIFEAGAIAGQIPCHECGGSGWWGYGPVTETNGPCVDCKGQGREWVGLL